MTTSFNLKKDMGVFINLGHKVIYGVVTEYNEGQYIHVKHDNFASEVFKVEQVVATDEGLII